MLQRPGDTAPANDILAFADKLDKFGSDYPTRAIEADTECTKLLLPLAQRLKASGQAGPEFERVLHEAGSAISSLPDSDDKAGFLREIATLRPPATAAVEPQAPIDIPGLLQKVQEFWDAGALRRALGIVNQILQTDPDNPAAKDWKQRITCALRMEKGESC
jgi:hypothetical protein